MSDNRFNVVVKHNDLVRNTVFSLEAMQQKLVLYLISQIMFDDNDLQVQQFDIRDFCKVLEINYGGANYKYVRDIVHEISNKNIKIKIDGSDTNLRIIEKYKMFEDSGVIEIKLDNDLKPYLIDLKSNFTKYELIYILNFKSKYSIRLYELFKSYEFTKSFEIEIDLLQQKLQSNYIRFIDFKRFVVEPALKEINKNTDLTVTVEYIKFGRSYKKIIFHIKNYYKSNNNNQFML